MTREKTVADIVVTFMKYLFAVTIAIITAKKQRQHAMPFFLLEDSCNCNHNQIHRKNSIRF